MNQILATGESSRKVVNEKRNNYSNNNKSDLGAVIKVFASILIIFAILLIGLGGYALYNGDFEEEILDVKPTILVENSSEESTIIVKANSKIGIESLIYNWNDEKEVILNGNSGEYVEQKVKIPNGTNNLNIRVIDIRGNETEFKKQYILNSNIELEATENGKINIKYKGETEIQYLTYRWDEENEEKVEIKDLEFEYDIDVIPGRHTLTVTVVDVNNESETKVQETSGISIPELNISYNEGKTGYKITAKDSIELKEIVITLVDNDNKRFGKKISGKEFNIELPFKKGDNRIKVEVINSDEQKVEKSIKHKVE